MTIFQEQMIRRAVAALEKIADNLEKLAENNNNKDKKEDDKK